MLHAVGQTPARATRTWPGSGAGLSRDSPPMMMDWKSAALRAADHRLESNRLIPTELLGPDHPSVHCNLERRSSASFLKVYAETPRQLG